MVRDTPERLETFAREVERMTRFLEARRTRFVMGFLKWRNHELVREHVGDGGIGRRLVDVKSVLAGEPKEDMHYTHSAHERMAALFCEVISEGVADHCTPPSWQRGAFAASPPERGATP